MLNLSVDKINTHRQDNRTEGGVEPEVLGNMLLGFVGPGSGVLLRGLRGTGTSLDSSGVWRSARSEGSTFSFTLPLTASFSLFGVST